MKKIIILTIVGATFLVSGCMAVSMLGGGGHSDHSNSSSTTVQKEVTSNGLKAEATFPTLTLNKETTFTVKITDAQTGKPVPGLAVWFHASFTHKPAEHHGGMMGNSSHHSMEHDGGMMGDSSSQPMEHDSGVMNNSSRHSKIEEQHGVNYDMELTETTSSSIFSVPFTATQTGEYVIAFHIVRDKQNQGEDIIVEQKLLVVEASHSSGGMMGSLGPYAIVVGAAMAAWMVYSLVSGSSMF